ncbi:MAG: DUF3347 domain-containing protein [Adhaeribacter sp.]
MKKTRIVYVLLAALTFSACAEKKQEAGNAATEHAGEEQAGQMPEAGKEVVKTPDYKTDGGPVKAALAPLLDGYLKISEALAASEFQTARQQAQAIVAATDQVPVAQLSGEAKSYASDKLKEIRQSADRMVQASDIKGLRAHLQALSEATFSLTKAFGASDQTLYYQYCPMANQNQGGYWLSANKEIRNPYFGSGMLTCGSTEEVLN